MSLEIELWALETTRGEAIVRSGGRWYRLRRETRWRPEDLGSREPPLPWGDSWLRVRGTCSSFESLFAGLEAALSASTRSPDEARAALRTAIEAPADPRSAWRDSFRSLVGMFQGRLDALFTDRGCSQEEALALILETFRRVFLLGPMQLDEVEARLPQMAADVFRERYGDVVRAPAVRREASHALDGVLQDALARLGTDTLRCLALWTDPRYRGGQLGDVRAAAALQMSEEEARRHVDLAAVQLGCTREQLGTPKMHAAYLQAFRTRLD